MVDVPPHEKASFPNPAFHGVTPHGNFKAHDGGSVGPVPGGLSCKSGCFVLTIASFFLVIQEIKGELKDR